MKTIISHFYNEEYLLPWWLKHHKQLFDHGIMVNYGSTDNSVNIIKEICPGWEIIDSTNESFDAFLVDQEIERIERNVSGWRITLNTTEFLFGDITYLDRLNIERADFFIASYPIIESPATEFETFNHDQKLITSKNFGIDPYVSNSNFKIRRARKLSNYFSNYPLGRHYESYNTKDFMILWYGYAPYNEELIKRKTQIQNKMPISDKVSGRGVQHLTDREKLLNELHNTFQPDSKDISTVINNFVGKMEKNMGYTVV